MIDVAKAHIVPGIGVFCKDYCGGEISKDYWGKCRFSKEYGMTDLKASATWGYRGREAKQTCF